MNRTKLKQPTAEEISAITSPSTETEIVELHKPAYDYLKSQLHSDDAVSAYVSNRITGELVRIAHLKPRVIADITTAEQKSEAQRKRWAKWRETHGEAKPHKCEHTVKIRAYEDAKQALMAIPNKRERSVLAGRWAVSAASHIDDAKLREYCQSHKGKGPCFVTVEASAVASLRKMASAKGVPVAKLFSFLVDQYESAQARFAPDIPANPA